MTHTNNLKLNFLYQNQIHKEIILNENLMITDAMISNDVKSMQSNELPSNASTGDKYILVKEGKIAVKLEDIWHYINVRDGMIFWIIDEEKLVVHSRGNWKTLFS